MTMVNNIMGNDIQWEIADNGKLQTMENCRQWEIVDNGKYQINDNNRQQEITDRPGGMAHNRELHKMEMTDNGE